MELYKKELSLLRFLTHSGLEKRFLNYETDLWQNHCFQGDEKKVCQS